MPFVVEYVLTRSSKEIDFPTEGAQRDKLAELREEYNISSEIFFSEDELTRTLQHTASDAQQYSAFYEKAQPLWEKEKVVQKFGNLDIDLTMSIVENT